MAVVISRILFVFFLSWGGLGSGAFARGGVTSDVPVDTNNPIYRIFGGQRLDLWSLRPVRSELPPILSSQGAKPLETNPIDRFIQARLSEEGILGAESADRRTLIRRLTYDLTGLPPEMEQVEAFIRDTDLGAWERLVDRLLASPRYGEHQARLWLDVIRYSDSNGFDWDEFRPEAWRFRDYVVRSFNADKPFDRLIREHLAGDELIAGAPANEAEREALLGTGYLRMGPHDNAASLFQEQDRSRSELLTDLVETTGTAFLGLTLACCRCHDHKFDPFSQVDHFRIRAFFEAVEFADELPLDLAVDQERIRQLNAEVERQVGILELEQTQLLAPAIERLRAQKIAELSRDDLRDWERRRLDPAALPEKRAKELEKKIKPEDASVLGALALGDQKRVTQLRGEIKTRRQQRTSFEKGLLMTDRKGEVPVTRVLFQGDHRQPRAEVKAGFLSLLDPNPAVVRRGTNLLTTGRRFSLAEWIVAPTNPLTVRVWVNRVWQQHFETGLVATVNDFGLAGARPSHPELLDWLAGEFVRGGWSVKQLHRLIVTSATYRQSSRASGSGKDAALKADPSNRLLWRQSPRRLSAEQLRDGLMALTGKLRWMTGGRPIWPDLPAEILQANPAFLDDNATRTKGWYPSNREEQTVRSVFLVQKRTVRVPFLETFDLPDNSVSCGRRIQSTVATQALMLLNSQMASDVFRSMADRVRQEAGEKPVRQVEKAFALALQRGPKLEEQVACVDLLRRLSLEELCRVLVNLNEFIHLD